MHQELNNIANQKIGKKIPCGKIATEKLKEIISNNKVTCNIKGTDRYSRKLGYCYARNININQEMVKRGYAVAYAKYDKKLFK